MAREFPIHNGRLMTDLDADGHRIVNLPGGGTYSVSWENVTGKPEFATVATSGSYNDIADKPTIPPAVTVDDTVTRTSANPVKSSGIWGAIWGALTALPSGFASLYDWCVAQLEGKMAKTVSGVYSFAWGADIGGDGMAVKIPSAGGTTKNYVFDDGVNENLNAVMRRSDMAGAVAEFLPYSLLAPEPSGVSLPAGVTVWWNDEQNTCTVSRNDILGDEYEWLGLCSPSGGEVAWNADGTCDSKSDGEINFRDAYGNVLSMLPNLVPTYPLADRAINGVSIPAAGAASLAFPAPVEGKVRDFLVRLTLGEGAAVNFPDTVAYETEDGEWPDFSEAGTYIIRLTEVAAADESTTPATPARFLMQGSSVAEATAGGGE